MHGHNRWPPRRAQGCLEPVGTIKDCDLNPPTTPMEDPTASMLNEIRQQVERLESARRSRVDAMAVSMTSKLPYKALLYREALVWRMAELARASLESFHKDRLVVGIVLIRAAMETSAALWYLCAKVDTAVKSGTVGDIDDYLMRLTMGTATTDPNVADPVLPRPVKVGAFLKKVDRDIQGFSHQYGLLSEYAHPNWAGTSLLYSRPVPEDRATLFGQNIRGDSTKKIAVINLSIALMMFEKSYTSMGDLMPAFITLCEQA